MPEPVGPVTRKMPLGRVMMSLKVSSVSCTWAQLYVDGECKGVHAFIVPLRDRRRHMPLPGITVGDCGKKLGNDAIDNGFIMFKDVRIPRKNLLNRFSDIVDGKFVSNYDNDDRRFAVSLGALSGGRRPMRFNWRWNVAFSPVRHPTRVFRLPGAVHWKTHCGA